MKIKAALISLPFIAIYAALYFLLLKDIILAYDCGLLYIQTGILLYFILSLFFYDLLIGKKTV